MAGARSPLPIDAVLPAIEASLREGPNLVLQAAPGAGKTTRVPPLLLDLVEGGVLVLEPRRIAARLAARRTAAERGEQVGETVGYQVRFEEAVSHRTRLRFVTEGLLTRRLLTDPELKGVDAVILDEFHERHLDTDLALALLKRLQGRRPELKLIVMSATLDAAPVAEFLGGCAVVRSEGRSFPLTIHHLPYSPLPLEQQVRTSLEGLFRAQHTGHVLVFLPGIAEIRRALRECGPAANAAGAELLPLYGDLAPEEQDRAVAPSSRQKIILATNVAESSVTIDGVTAVIDSGLARIASHSAWSGLPSLHVNRISKASAVQRAGRAGRTGPGTAIRLYPQEDFAQRPAYDIPEILRADLSGLCLNLRAMEVEDTNDLQWLDPPPSSAVDSAQTLLDRLGAHGDNARELARFPLSPRLAKVLAESAKRGVAEEGIAVTALLSSGIRCERTDLLDALETPPDGGTQRLRRQLRGVVRPTGPSTRDEAALLLSILTGFPDRVARLRSGKQLLLANGLGAELSGEQIGYDFLVAVDAEARGERQSPLVRMTSRIEPEWLLDLFPERVHEDTVLEWNSAAERVEVVSSLRYDELVIAESRGGSGDPEAVSGLLGQQAAALGLERFVDPSALQTLRARLFFAGLQDLDEQAELWQLSEGLRSFAELRDAAEGLLGSIEARTGSSLRELAPAVLRLPAGRSTKVQYEIGKPPWIESRLQDFFGLEETPRIGRERTPVVVHLLAPNKRAVQTTTDLRGFWERLYPQVRRELMRRYPRHAWPENPKQPQASTVPSRR